MRYIGRTGKHPNGRLAVMVVGLASILDGLITVLSIGYLNASFSFGLIAFFTKRSLR